MSGQVRLNERVRRALHSSESLVVIRVDPTDISHADRLTARLQTWTLEFPRRWPRDGEVITDSVWQLPDGGSIFTVTDPPNNAAYAAILDDLVATLAELNFDISVDL